MNANSTRAEAMSAAKLLRVPWHFIRNKLELFKAMRSVADFPSSIQPSIHSLPGELIVSLTSYPKRYATLPLTLKSLLNQSVKPDRVILWIADADYGKLPASVLQLTEYGLEIRKCFDMKSYNKLIPTLLHHPTAFVITADDDVYYERSWVKRLVDVYNTENPEIICHRVHLVKFNADGSLSPYSDWVQEAQIERPSDESRIFPTGIGGVLYYPGCLDPEVTNADTFMSICPNADDVWFYWMGRRKGSKYKKTSGRFLQVTWPSTQGSALMIKNWGDNGNDKQIKAMEEAYGNVSKQRELGETLERNQAR